MMTPAQILIQHFNKIDEIYNEHAVETVGGEVALPDSVKLPSFPENVFFKGEPARAQELLDELASQLSVGYSFVEYNFADYAPNIHHLFATEDKDWDGVDVRVFVFEELDENGNSYFGDGTNKYAHPTSKLLFVITSSIIGGCNFLPHPDGLDDLEPCFLLDRDENIINNLVETIENYDEDDEY